MHVQFACKHHTTDDSLPFWFLSTYRTHKHTNTQNTDCVLRTQRCLLTKLFFFPNQCRSTTARWHSKLNAPFSWDVDCTLWTLKQFNTTEYKGLCIAYSEQNDDSMAKEWIQTTPLFMTLISCLSNRIFSRLIFLQQKTSFVVKVWEDEIRVSYTNKCWKLIKANNLIHFIHGCFENRIQRL